MTEKSPRVGRCTFLAGHTTNAVRLPATAKRSAAPRPPPIELPQPSILQAAKGSGALSILFNVKDLDRKAPGDAPKRQVTDGSLSESPADKPSKHDQAEVPAKPAKGPTKFQAIFQRAGEKVKKSRIVQQALMLPAASGRECHSGILDRLMTDGEAKRKLANAIANASPQSATPKPKPKAANAEHDKDRLRIEKKSLRLIAMTRVMREPASREDLVEVADVAEPRDVATVLRHIAESGHVNICSLKSLLTIAALCRNTVFSGVPESGIVQALQCGHVYSSPANTMLWRWTGVERDGGLELCGSARGIFLVLSGRVAMLSCKMTGDQMVQEFVEGCCGDTDHQDVVGLWAMENTVILWMPKERIRARLQHFLGETDLLRSRQALGWAEKEMDMLADMCHVYPFFEDHAHGSIKKIVRVMKFKQFHPGDVLTSQGEFSDTLFFILSGTAKAYRAKSESWAGNAPPSVLRGHATIVNESALFERSQSEVTIKCADRCDILMLTRSAYEKALGAEQIARQRMVYILRSIPPTHPGEVPNRSEKQLLLLSKIVENTPEFRDMPRKTLLNAMGAAVYMSAASNHIIFHEGDIGDKFYAIIEGKIAVRKKVQKTEEEHLVPANPMFMSERSQDDDDTSSRAEAGSHDHLRKSSHDHDDHHRKGSCDQDDHQHRRGSRESTDHHDHHPHQDHQHGQPDTKDHHGSALRRTGTATRMIKRSGTVAIQEEDSHKQEHKHHAHKHHTVAVGAHHHGDRSHESRDMKHADTPRHHTYTATKEVHSRDPSHWHLHRADSHHSQHASHLQHGYLSGNDQDQQGQTQDLQIHTTHENDEEHTANSPHRSPSHRRRDEMRFSTDHVYDTAVGALVGERLHPNEDSQETLHRLEALAKESNDLGALEVYLQTGQTFGAKTLLHQEPRTASIVTVEPTKFLIISRGDFVALMKAKLETDIQERLQFLLSHLPGLDQAQIEVSSNEMQKLERAAVLLNTARFDHGRHVVTEGDDSGHTLWFLDTGALAVLGSADSSHNAAQKASKPRVQSLVTTAGQIIGTTTCIIGKPEPSTVVVESASCTLYSVDWSAVWRLLPQRVLDALRKYSEALYDRRCHHARPLPPCILAEKKARERAAFRTAWSGLADGAKLYGDLQLAPDALPHEKLIGSPTRVMPDRKKNYDRSKSKGVQSARDSSKETALTTPSKNEQSDWKLNYTDGITTAMRRIDEVIVAGCGEHTPHQRDIKAPPGFCAERLKAELVQAMFMDPSPAVQKFVHKSVQHSTIEERNDLHKWIKHYVFDPRVITNRHVQEVMQKYRIGADGAWRADGKRRRGEDNGGTGTQRPSSSRT